MPRKYTKDDLQIVLDLIPEGRGEAKPCSYFTSLTGFKRREFTDIIQKLREEHPICATKEAPGGYWLGNSRDCLEMSISMQAVANTTSKNSSVMFKHYLGLGVNDGTT